MALFRHIGLVCLLSLLLAPRVSVAQQMEFMREVGANDNQSKRLLNAPQALTSHGDRLYVADTDNHRIVVLDRRGTVNLSWGAKGSKPGQFRWPAGIAVDDQGRVYVSDTGNNRVQVFDAEGKLLLGFGDKGDGPREFSSPAGIAVSKGLLYVADTGNDRVQVLSLDGIFMTQITAKTAKDEMKSPLDVAVDALNRIYVLDAGKNRVRVFDPSGAQLAEFGSRGSGAAKFEKPQGIAVDNRGNIYVADTGNFLIKKFTGNGKPVGSAGSRGDGPGQFIDAAGLTVDLEGNIWVLDSSKDTVQVFNAGSDKTPVLTPVSPLPTVEFIREMRGGAAALAINKRVWGLLGDSLSVPGAAKGAAIGSRGGKPAFFKDPRGLAVDGQGNFWVADTGNDRLQKFSLDGKLLHVVGKSGSGEGEFHSPSGIAISPKGNICVADTGNKRIQVFSPKGIFIGAFGKYGKQAGQFNEVVDIAVDGSENFIIVDRGNDRIAKYDSKGGLLWEMGKTGPQDAEFRAPENVLVSPDNEVYVLDAGNARIQVFDSTGKFLRKFGSPGIGPGQFEAPRGLALEDGRRLFVGDLGNKRVQLFLLKFTPGVPKEVSAAARPNAIQLNWKAVPETQLEHYKIYRGGSPSDVFTLAGTTGEPFYLDRGLQSNRAFHYRVSSQAREGNESALSDLVSAVTPKLVPGVPRRIRTEANEKQITLSWLPDREPFVVHYHVYRTTQVSAGFKLLVETDRTIVTDGPLEDESMYYYQITAVGRDGDESPASEVVFASTPGAQPAASLQIAGIETSDIFASAYQYYESHPLGKVMIVNNTNAPLRRIKMSFSIRGLMDDPVETEIPEIAPRQQQEIFLTPFFNKKILEATENAQLRGEVALTPESGPQTMKRSFPLALYERDAIRWDRKEKLGAFVTYQDPVVEDFTRQVARQYVDAHPNLPRSIVYARGVYDALGVLGIRYSMDPTSPFTEFSGSAAAVDYLQYPRDTLAKKSGDCDDLSVLFAACMESIGIGAAFVDVPGHLMVMLNTGVPGKDGMTLGFPDELLVTHQGTVWIPMEMTMVGASFTRAWQKGAEEYRASSAKKQAEIIVVQKSWDEFRPIALPRMELNLKVRREEIESAHADELDMLGRRRLANLSAVYRDMLKKTPSDLNALGEFGILYAENGFFAEALEQFQKMLAQDKTNAMALNNIGNINYLQGRLDDARQAYEAARRASPEDPGITVNLARAALQAGKKEEAKKLFLDAMAIDPRVARQYPDIAAGLGMK